MAARFTSGKRLAEAVFNTAAPEISKKREEGSPHTSLSGRIPELDGLRGIAIGMVVVYHYFLLTIPVRPGTLPAYMLASGRLAWSGVDLFFVLSGFLIGGILLDARDSSNYFRVFYTRRFFRIVPIYAVLLAGAFAMSQFVNWGTAGRGVSMSQNEQLPWLAYVLFIQNFWMVARTSLGLAGLGQTWSLAVEEQFYLTLPALIRKVSPPRLVTFLLVGILAAPVLRTLFYILSPDPKYAGYFGFLLMPCRADALLLGVLGAVAMRKPNWRARLQEHRGVMLSLLGILALGCLVLTKEYPRQYGRLMVTVGLTWLALFYLCILLCALLYPGTWLGRCLRWRWLSWLGTIAYGVYLLHEPVRYILFGLFWSGPPSIVSFREFFVTVLALVITLGVCRLSWLFFEKPLVQLGHRARYQPDEARKTPVVAGMRVEREAT